MGDNIPETKVMPIREALRLADEMELDLVEISPKADPPVCRIIEADAARPALTFYNIGLETLPIVVVHDLHLLARNHVRGVHQVLVNGDAPHIIQIRFRHTHAMQLRLQHLNHHILPFL